mgnify:CR=1 FL=1
MAGRPGVGDRRLLPLPDALQPVRVHPPDARPGDVHRVRHGRDIFAGVGAGLPAGERRAAPSKPATAEAPAEQGADEYRVRSGDTLSRIAGRTQRPGVSLDQMLVSLYRGNPQAFIESNMNRLRSGVVLSVR